MQKINIRKETSERNDKNNWVKERLQRDGLLLARETKAPAAIIEFQTTNKISVAKHCNNKYFGYSGDRGGANKGDEQRWKVAHQLALETKLPLVVIVWSPKETEIKYKVVSDVVYSDDYAGRRAGLVYEEKMLVSYAQLVEKLGKLEAASKQ